MTSQSEQCHAAALIWTLPLQEWVDGMGYEEICFGGTFDKSVYFPPIAFWTKYWLKRSQTA